MTAAACLMIEVPLHAPGRERHLDAIPQALVPRSRCFLPRRVRPVCPWMTVLPALRNVGGGEVDYDFRASAEVVRSIGTFKLGGGVTELGSVAKVLTVKVDGNRWSREPTKCSGPWRW